MANHTSFFLFSLFFLLSYGRTHSFTTHHLIGTKSLLPSTTCSKVSPSGIKDSPSILPLFNRDGACSLLSNKRETVNYTEFLIQDQTRVHSIHSRISRGGDDVLKPEQAKLPANSGTSLGTGNFFVTLGFGSPKKDLPLIFDTGSDLTWIQCQPCIGGCYPQRDPIFDPKASTSYSNFSCTSNECTQLSSGTGNTPGCSASTSACVYGIQYGDQSFSVGIFAKETLTVTPSDVFSNFQFGCGQNNDGLFGRAAGLLGLGRNTISFVSQTADKYKKLFSYCIPFKASGFLAFGVPSSVVKYTPLLKDSRGPSFYFLTLQGISVGGKVLPISASTFSVGGTIIDSGTVITRLAPAGYSALRTAFRAAMKSYPTAPALSILDTCYDFTGLTTIKVPKISLLFAGGTSMDVAQSGILFASRISQVCLAFAGNTDAGDVTIIGNKQQQTLEVVYDVDAGKLGFGAGGCS